MGLMRQIETLPTGRYKVRFRHGVSTKTGKAKQVSESFDTYRQAEQFTKWLDALGPQGALDRLYEGEQAAATPSLDQVAAAHIEHLTGVTDGYRLTSTRLWARTWGPLIGHVPADSLNRDDVARALNELAKRYAAGSLENQRGLLHGVAERCIEQGYLKTNPVKRLRLPQGKAGGEADDGEMVCLTPDEFELLHQTMAARYQPLVRFLVGTGCRWGEAVALTKSDLSLSGQPTVKIRRALKWSPDGKRTIGVPKTKRSRRMVTLPTEVAVDLRALVEDKAAGDLVFTAPRGGMIQHRTFWYDQWRPALWRAQHCGKHTKEGCRCGTAHPRRCKLHDAPPPPCGCPGALGQSPRIHDLRHSHASWLLARGVPIHVVSARLGHESVKTTWDVYSHLLPDAQFAAADAASMAFAQRAALD